MLQLNKTNVTINVIYATQTGNSFLAAELVEEELVSFKFKVNLLSISEFNFIDTIRESSINIFIVSTTGYGEIPTSMRPFWKFILNKSFEEDFLENMNYTIFGLGDSSYEKFNLTSKMLDKRLEQLGAMKFFPIGLGDDQHDFGWEGEFDPWLSKLIIKLNKLFNDENCQKITTKKQTKYQVLIENKSDYINDNNKKYVYKDVTKRSIISKGIISTKQNEKDKDKIIFKLIFDNSNMETKPGDILMIYPQNLDYDILLEKLGYKDETHLNICILLNNQPIYLDNEKESISISTLFKHLNFYGTPNRKFCPLISNFCDDILLKDKLILFGEKTPEGKDEFYRYCFREKRTYYDILYDFGFFKQKTKIPLSILVESIGFIKPREYSISDYNNNKIEIILNLHTYNTYFGKEKIGFCSNFLFKSESNQFINTQVIKGSFPKIQLDQNYILISTGTGITPLNYLIKERDRLINNSNNDTIGSLLLFYGCRLKEYDNIVKYENLDELKNIKIHYSFSRESETKRYVQHSIESNSDAVKDLISSDKTNIIIIGNSKTLPGAIEKILKNISLNENIITVLKNKGRYYVESW